jgi:hypothetical protein
MHRRHAQHDKLALPHLHQVGDFPSAASVQQGCQAHQGLLAFLRPTLVVHVESVAIATLAYDNRMTKCQCSIPNYTNIAFNMSQQYIYSMAALVGIWLKHEARYKHTI